MLDWTMLMYKSHKSDVEIRGRGKSAPGPPRGAGPRSRLFMFIEGLDVNDFALQMP